MKASLLAVAVAAVLSGQTTFRTSTKLIEVGVVVTDKAGKSVDGLTQADFELMDGGKRQDVRAFTVQRGQQSTSAAEALPAGFFSNRLSATGATPNSATVILVDALNTPPEYYGQAREKLSKFLHGIDPRYRVAIYRLGLSGLTIFHDFTSDTGLLARKAIEARDLLALATEVGMVGRGDQRTAAPGSVQYGGGESLTDRVEVTNPQKAGSVLFGGGDALDLIAALMDRRERIGGAFESSTRVTTTLQAMTAIANRLKAVPGRKNLVWITTGMPLKVGFHSFAQGGRLATNVQYTVGERDSLFSLHYERAMRALNDAAVAVYPIDARGVLALGDAARFSLQRETDLGGSVFLPSRRGMVTSEPFATESNSTLKNLAAETGGRVYAGDAVDRALSDVFENTRVSYVLGYYAPAIENDGRFRKIQVKVNRPGVRVIHRTGYYAIPDERLQEDAKAALLAAVWSPVDATALPLEAVLELGSGDAEAERTLALRVDGEALDLEPAGNGTLHCRLEVFVVQKDGEGKQIEGASDGLVFPLKQDQVAEMEKTGLMHRKKLRIQPRAFTLRVVVRSPVSGAMGSLTIPLSAPSSD